MSWWNLVTLSEMGYTCLRFATLSELASISTEQWSQSAFPTAFRYMQVTLNWSRWQLQIHLFNGQHLTGDMKLKVSRDLLYILMMNIHIHCMSLIVYSSLESMCILPTDPCHAKVLLVWAAVHFHFVVAHLSNTNETCKLVNPSQLRESGSES